MITAIFNLFAVSSIEAIKSKNTSDLSIGGRKIHNFSSLISIERAVLTNTLDLFPMVVYLLIFLALFCTEVIYSPSAG